MAIAAQGMTVTWGGAALAEVREVSIDQDRFSWAQSQLPDSRLRILQRASTGCGSSWCSSAGLERLRILPQ